ncbi:MAG: carbohydrate kinase family protein [archaeon]
MLDVISIGSAAQDVFVHIPQEYFAAKTCVFYPGSKIEIKDMDYFSGGGATNTSVAFSRMGLKAGILCALGDDKSASEILAELKREKVDARFIPRMKGMKTPYSVILTGFSRDRIILCYSATSGMLSKAKIGWKNLRAKWFHISSLHSKPALLGKILGHAKKTGARISFNPGSEELKLGVQGLKRIVGKAGILFLNNEEALKLTGSADVHRNLKKLLELAEIVVITEGKHGSHATNGTSIFSAGIFPVKMIDVTGAGDAFASGFASAIIKGRGIEDALVYGTANASSIVTALGTKNILLSEKGIKKFLSKHGKLKITKEKL